MDKPSLKTIDDALEQAEALIEHALGLGYLGDGSTRGWALSALQRVQDARILMQDAWRKSERAEPECNDE